MDLAVGAKAGARPAGAEYAPMAGSAKLAFDGLEPLGCCTDQCRLSPVVSIDDRDVVAQRAGRSSNQISPNAAAKGSHHATHSSAENYYFRFKQIDNVAQPYAEVIGGFFQDFFGHSIAPDCRFAY